MGSISIIIDKEIIFTNKLASHLLPGRVLHFCFCSGCWSTDSTTVDGMPHRHSPWENCNDVRHSNHSTGGSAAATVVRAGFCVCWSSIGGDLRSGSVPVLLLCHPECAPLCCTLYYILLTGLANHSLSHCTNEWHSYYFIGTVLLYAILFRSEKMNQRAPLVFDKSRLSINSLENYRTSRPDLEPLTSKQPQIRVPVYMYSLLPQQWSLLLAPWVGRLGMGGFIITITRLTTV